MRAIMIWAICLSGFYNLNAQNISDADRKFIYEAALANMLEVKLGEMAQSHSQTDKVKILGEHMITDHTKSEIELKALAAKKGIILPTNLDQRGYKIYDNLIKKMGQDFDKDYTKLMVKEHKKNIADLKKQAEKGDDAEVKAWAEKMLPVFEGHQTMAEAAFKAVRG